MADIDDLFTPPNAAAYEKQELRKGVPLSYVGEKLRSSLYYLHGLCTTIREVVPDDSTVPSPVETEHYDEGREIGRASGHGLLLRPSFLPRAVQLTGQAG